MINDLPLVVGVDLGGTSISVAVVNAATGDILAMVRRKTNAEEGAAAVCERIAVTVRKVIKEAGVRRKDLCGVGVGVPGPVNPMTGVVATCPNLGDSWDDFPLSVTLAELLNLPVTVDNDVNVGAVGEHTFGAGRGACQMMAIFVGTGIGGGLIIDGQLYGGQRNAAGEIGHMVLDPDGPLCGCGQPGHVEALASRTAMERDIRAALDAGRSSLITDLLAQAGRTTMSAGVIGDAYEAGDALVREVVQQAQYYLGLAISGCVNLFDPEVIVVGGGVLERMGDAYLEPVRAVAQQHYVNKKDLDKVRIVSASLGDASGSVGAAVLAHRRLAKGKADERD